MIHYFVLLQISEQASLFVRLHGLALLQRLTEQFESTETFTAVASVLGNLVIFTRFHEPIVRAGWLGVLKEWTESRHSKLAVAAGRVLANLDRDFSSDVLDDGIIILHPIHRSRYSL